MQLVATVTVQSAERRCIGSMTTAPAAASKGKVQWMAPFCFPLSDRNETLNVWVTEAASGHEVARLCFPIAEAEAFRQYRLRLPCNSSRKGSAELFLCLRLLVWLD